MSIADRYPDLRDYQLPAWIANAPDTDDDLVKSARIAFLEAVQETSPLAQMPLTLDLRLSGPSTADGAIPDEAMVIASQFAREVREALPGPSSRDLTLDWIGTSEGSAIIHMRPRFAKGPDADQLAIPQIPEVEAAIQRVLDVHQRLEGEADEASFANERTDLLDRVRQLTESLDDQQLSLDVTALGTQGEVYEATLTARGIRHAKSLFSQREHRPTTDVLEGLVVSTDLEALTIAMRVDGVRAKAEVHEVPRSLIESGALRAGLNVRITVRTETSSDGAGKQKKQRRTWIDFAGEDLMMPEP